MAAEIERLDSVPEEDREVLRELELEFRVEYRLLVCTRCNQSLGKSAATHLKRTHACRTSASQKRLLARYSPDSHYHGGFEGFLPAVDFRPVEDGFKCSECYYFASHLQVMQRHVEGHAERATMDACHVQRMNDCTRTPYVGVFIAAENRPSEAIDDQNANDDAIDALMVMERFRQQRVLLPEQGARQGLFYSLSGFAGRPGLVDEFSEIDKASYVGTLSEDHGDYAFFTEIRMFLAENIPRIVKADVQLRFAVSAGGRPFGPLQMDKSVKEYTLVMARFARFLVQHRRAPLPEVPLPEELAKKIDIFVHNPDVQTFASMIVTVLEADPRKCAYSDLLSLFIRFCCTMTPGNYMKAENIERLIAKLFYMCRLSIVVHVTLQDREDRTREFNDCVDLLKTGTGNVFSNVILLKSMAHAEVSSTARPPTIIPSPQDPYKIEINGYPVSATDIRNTYRKSLQRCKELLKSLLFGRNAPKLVPVDRISDEKPLEGMHCHADLKKHREIEATLLKSILEDEDLCARFIRAGRGAEVVFNASEGSRYLVLYDEFIENLFVLIHIGSGMPARATEITTLTRVNGCTALRGLYYSHGQVFTLNCYNKTRNMKGLNTSVARFLDEQASKIVLLDNLVIRPFVSVLASSLGRNREDAYVSDIFVLNGERLEAEAGRSIFASLFSRYSGRPLTFGLYRHVAKYFANLLGIDDKIFPDANISDDRNDDYDFDHAEFEQEAASQFGHSRSVGDRNYALTAGEHSRIREHHVIRYRQCSEKWHVFLNYTDLRRTQGVRPHANLAVDLNQLFTGTGQSQAPVNAIAANNRNNNDSNGPGTNVRCCVSSIFLDTQPSISTTRPGVVPSNTVLGRQIRSGNEIDLNEIVVELDLEPLHYRLDHHVSKRPKFVKENFLTTDPALNPLTLLRKLTADHNANFRSNEQEDAASHLLNTKANLILILPTGSGKSMLVLLIASALPYYLTVVVVPTVALRQDLARRAEELAIRVAQSIEEFTNQNLLILTPEARTCPSAFKFFVDMKAKNRLYRIFIDEVHLVSTDSSWRESLKRLPMLGYFEIPLVLMSGTCPDHVVDEIQSSFFTDATKPVIIKQKSDRPSIRYAVNVCPSNESKLDQSLPYLQSLQFDEKAIIYVPYRSDTIEMSQFLCALGIQARAYHSELDDEERRANFADWRAGISSVMVATSAFGVGIDDPNVSLVVMLGLPYSFLEYIQASGRAARGSRNGLALLIIDEMEERRRLMRCSNLYERELVFDLLSYSLIRNVCRRRMIGTYLDGSCTSCEHLLGCEKCDACLPSAYILPHRSLVETVEASGEAFTIRENNADDDFRPFVPEAPREPFVGAKAAALQIISTEKASEISLSAVLKKINGFCGICLASERKAINHGSSYCPVAIGVCSICFLKGHSAKQCRLKTIAIPSKLLCYRCFQPWVVNGEKTHNDEDSCTNSTVVKDFYRRAAYAKLFDGISDTTFKPDIFYPALVRFCQSYLQ